MNSILPFDIGDVILDRYYLMSLLGNGGFGQVFLTYDCWRRQCVALKVSRSSLAKEGEVLTGLSHKGLPRVYAVERVGRVWILAMEYIRGSSLADMLHTLRDEGRKISLMSGVDISIQLCSTLLYMHEHRPAVIHRDVKPQNVLISPRGVVLIDFGIAVSSEISGVPLRTRAGGTPGYMAPEHQYDFQPATDVFGLGVTLLAVFERTSLPHERHRTMSLLYQMADPNPMLRPQLQDVRQTLLRWQKDISSGFTGEKGALNVDITQ